MLKRILTAAVAIAVLLPVLYFSDTVVFPLVMALCSLIGAFEMLRCTKTLKKWAMSVPVMLLCGGYPMVVWFCRDDRALLLKLAMGGTILAAVYLFAIMTFSHGKITLNEASVTFMTAFYIAGAFTALTALRYYPQGGEYLYLICFIGAWVTDTFAYFCGRLFGKHKLIPDVSPKKTIEGSIGGTLFCVGAMILYGVIVHRIAEGTLEVNFLMLGVSGLLIAVVSQIGDLLMSSIKRVYGIKDYGRLFPGHGGVLDRFDSVLAVSVMLAVISMSTNLFTVIG